MLEEKQSVIRRTRRSFLKGCTGKRHGHIASVVVQAWPDRLSVIEERLTRADGVECHGSSSAGKLILTIEADDDAGLVTAMSRIESTKGVVTASLVYHHIEEMDDE